MRRKRRIGAALVVLGLIPLGLLGGALLCLRITGGAVPSTSDDHRTFAFFADSFGFPETSPRSRLVVSLVINSRGSMGPLRRYRPWYARRDFSLLGDLARRDTGAVRGLADAEMASVLRRHGEEITQAFGSMYKGWPSDVPPIVGEMARAGEPHRRVSTVVWQNIPYDVVEAFGGWLGLGVWGAVVIAGAWLWRANRAVPAGHCLECGYDLRGNPEGVVCPECGTPQTRVTPVIPRIAAPSEP